MANIKSAAKRAQIAKVRTLRNKSAMSKVKTTIKSVEAALPFPWRIYIQMICFNKAKITIVSVVNTYLG